ncbi:hypothetical protein H6F76_20120 [Leptolyngbya sp. FACHB-321]|uniref:hypothetical protein n=1 Tax=Leptolyngbya sp. FACHB-321 TaxID=2692807 RepID=UPI00168A1F1E|nr:hypothetical protein [Leptolyngbya sp. FACHB-321]MBD2037274.1 hypothetical protein [Leptolyngbya sp. FACHB-321]
MSLKNSWQQQQQQRQQEVTQRQQEVSASLAATRQDRQAKAVQLRHELSLFREVLGSQNTARRTELQQFCQRLHLETQSFLAAAGDRRYVQATQLAAELNLFVQMLQQQTAAFLTEAQAERAVAAPQLKQELVAFVSDLRSDVQSYLIELEAVRENQAVQLSQALIDGRAKREAETQALFQRLAVFRAELQRFSQDLHHTVWGGESAANIETPAAKLPAVAQASTKNGNQPTSCIAVLPNESVAVPATVEAQHSSAVAVTSPAKVMKASQEGIGCEKEVYAYIQNAQGARLTEIERALNLSRFQAVDALRSLIKKGLITQRDRIYLAQGHLAHT